MSSNVQLAKLLVQDWLELSIDKHLQLPEVGFDESTEPNYLRVSWTTDDPIIAYRKLLNVHEDSGPGISSNLRRKFHDGMDTQARYIKYFREMGVLDEPEGWDEDQGALAVNHDFGIKGHIDARVRTPEGQLLPVELKAVNSNRFRRYVREPELGHVKQLQMYMFLDNAPSGFLLAECKDDQTISLRRLKFDPEAIVPCLAVAAQVWQWVKEERDPFLEV